MEKDNFVFLGLPTRVIFGAGRLADLHVEAKRLGMARPLVITGRQQSELGGRVADQIGAAVFDRAAMHTPDAVTETAMELVAAKAIDGTIAIGGGSAIGLGKAIAWRSNLPQIAVPTTYAGSEMTDILGETAGGAKTTRRDPKIQPETVIYDPDLTLTLPASLAATSGMNAIAHAVEALYARDTNPVTAMLSEEGIRALAAALPALETSRGQAFYGAWLCGTALGTTAMALHHKLCHVLGGSFGLPHSETHTVILPQAMAYNAPTTPQAMARIARALGAATAAGGIFDLTRQLGAPTTLEELGFKRSDIARAAGIAVSDLYWNPREVTREGVESLLDDAFHGRRPSA